ncbi:MAG TPA: major capsid protein, partial [Pseudonocardia sp.]
MELTLQEIIDAIGALGDDATDDTKNEAVAALIAERGADAEKVSNLALDEYRSVREGSEKNENTMAALGALVHVVEGARLRQNQVDEETRARDEALAALDSRINPNDSDETGTDDQELDENTGTGDDPDNADGDGDGGATGTEGDSEKAGGGGSGAESATAAGEQSAPAEAVAASGRRRPQRVSLATVNRTRPPVEKPAQSLAITASADVPGYSMGQKLDVNGLTSAVIARMSAFPQERIQGAVMRAGIARIKIPFADKNLIADDTRRDQDVFDYAGNQRRLPNGNVAAAGGWCSPSETLYDLCPGLESPRAGMVDVPDIQINRGGIRTTEGPDIGSVFSSIGFKQTEAQAIAGDTKPCYRVPCPSFTETRAGVTGVCIVSGILQDDAYPEMTRRIVELAVATHAHKVNADTLAAMEAGSTDMGTVNAGISAATSLLNVIEMQVMDYRYRYRADDNLLLEMPIPFFGRAMIRSDLSLRTGIPFEQVSNAQIDGWFAQRGVIPQWVYDWQDAFTGVSAGFGAATPIEAWPTSIKIMLYAAGTWVRGRGEVISMEGIYD